MVSATTNRQTAGTKLPTTRCTNCQTVFELPLELLDSADTRVRCGECLCIFDAREGLVPNEQAATSLDANDGQPLRAPKKRKKNKSNRSARMRAAERKVALNDQNAHDDASSLDVTYSDFDLFSEDADLPALAYLDETRDTPEFNFDAVELGDEETFSDTLFAHDVTINADLPIPETADTSSVAELDASTLVRLQRTDVDFSVDKVPEEPLIFNYQDPPARDEGSESVQENTEIASVEVQDEQPVVKTGLKSDLDENVAYVPVESEIATGASGKNLSGVLVWVFGSILLLGALIATVVYPRWETLDQSATFRPIKVAVCEVAGCQVNTRVDTDQLKVLKREVVEASGIEDALSINIELQNTADFEQRYPVVEVRMNNRVGRVVAQRAFTPTDYLPNWVRGEVLEAGEIIDIELVVNDPGVAANDFNLSLREFRLNCSPVIARDGSERWPADCAKP